MPCISEDASTTNHPEPGIQLRRSDRAAYSLAGRTIRKIAPATVRDRGVAAGEHDFKRRAQRARGLPVVPVSNSKVAAGSSSATSSIVGSRGRSKSRSSGSGNACSQTRQISCSTRRRPPCRFEVLTLTSSGNPTMPRQVSGSIKSDGGGSGRSSPPAKSSGSRTLRRARKSVSGRLWTIPNILPATSSGGNSQEDAFAPDPRGYPRESPTHAVTHPKSTSLFQGAQAR
jgi:hypothetical protein